METSISADYTYRLPASARGDLDAVQENIARTLRILDPHAVIQNIIKTRATAQAAYDPTTWAWDLPESYMDLPARVYADGTPIPDADYATVQRLMRACDILQRLLAVGWLEMPS